MNSVYTAKSNANSQNLHEWLDTVTNFIKKSTILIINSRKKYDSSKADTVPEIKINFKTANLKEVRMEKEDLEKIYSVTSTLLPEIEEDEYAGLKPLSKTTSTHTTRNSLPTGRYTNERIISVAIYFKRKNVKFIVELWKFTVCYNSSSADKITFRRSLLLKKLSVMIRSLLSITRILPVYSLFIKKGFDFNFDFQIENSNIDLKNELDPMSNVNYENMMLNNYADNIGALKVDVKYISKNRIFVIEEEMRRKVFDEENLIKRQRFLSEENIIFTSNSQEINLELRKMNSKSVSNEKEVELGINAILETEIKFEGSVKKYSDPFLYMSNGDFTGYLIKNEDLINKKFEIISIRKKINSLGDSSAADKERENIDEDLSFFCSSDEDSDYDSRSVSLDNEDFELKFEEEGREDKYYENLNKSYIETLSFQNVVHRFSRLRTKLDKSKISLNVHTLISKTNVFSERPDLK